MTATRVEFQAVARALPFPYSVSQYGFRALASTEHGFHVLLIQSGIGPNKARTTSRKLLHDASWDVIISSGFAGDLVTNTIGSILIGETVFLQSLSSSPLPSMACHPDWVKMALGIGWAGEGPLRNGTLVSVDRVLTHASEKHQLHRQTEAIGADMESAAIGEIAQEYNVPFVIIRAISDGVDEDLPVDFNLFLTRSGWVAGIWSILSTPKSWKKFVHLYRHANQASRQLTRYFEGFFSGISQRPFSPASFRGET